VEDLSRGARADETEGRGSAHKSEGRDHAQASSRGGRWSVLDLDIFWPILAVTLVLAVVFVASVAHNSMDQVGAPTANIELPLPKPTSTNTTIIVVQVSSHPTKSEAEAAADALAARGFQPQVLNSDDFRPMNPGFYVVYTGPYPATASGRAEAKRIQGQLPGALVRELRNR
jgi:hypothetical protein